MAYRSVVSDFTLLDAASQPWTLSQRRGEAVTLVFVRGDWCPFCQCQLMSLAAHHQDLAAAGSHLVAITSDSPEQNAAVIEACALTFPLLSDHDRSGAIEPYRVADERDPRGISLPAVIVVSPEGHELFRAVGGDPADRVSEDELFSVLEPLKLPPVTPEDVAVGSAKAGPHAVTLDMLGPYLLGARGAVMVLSERLGANVPASNEFLEMLERYRAVVRQVRRSHERQLAKRPRAGAVDPDV